MAQYSIIAVAECDTRLESHLILLDRGRNLFNLVTDDIEEVVKELEALKVRIVEKNLITMDPSKPEDILVSGSEAIQDIMGPLKPL